MRRWDRWRRWQCIALRTKMAGSCTRCHKLIGEWIQRLSKMGCPLAELKETSTTCYWTKTVIESMILTKFHSITHHSSRINYVGQFDVNVGWTQRSVEETWLFVTSKSQPNKCLVKPRRQRLQRWTQTPTHPPQENTSSRGGFNLRTRIRLWLIPTTRDHICLFLFIWTLNLCVFLRRLA